MDLSKELDFAINFVKKAGEKALNNWTNFSTDIHSDGVDVTTSTDKNIEKDFAEEVNKNFPNYGFQGEEFKELNREGEFMWQIDPIDGTKFYAASVPFWTITVALLYQGEPVLGVIYNPVANQIHYAAKGKGAFLNNKKIELSKEIDITKLQGCGDFALGPEDYLKRKEKIDVLMSDFLKTFYRVRFLGSGTFGLAWLAQGFFGAYLNPYRSSKKFVDIAGGIIIAKEAGAEVYKAKIHGEDDLYNIIVARAEVVEKVAPMFKKLDVNL